MIGSTLLYEQTVGLGLKKRQWNSWNEVPIGYHGL